MVEEDIRKITGVITAVTPILERLNRKDSLAKIQERIRQIQNTEVKVLICGEFKRGSVASAGSAAGSSSAASSDRWSLSFDMEIQNG